MRTRSTLIDTLKILACQLIVLHHLAVYSPMAHVLDESHPTLLGVLGDEGRLVVQCFLVIAGFLAAQAILSGRQLSLPQAIWGRYLRLAPQFAVALLVLMLVMAAVAPFYQPEWMSPWPSLWEFMAHVLMLQGVLAVPALSAGAWYVAIDFQLYVSFAVLMCLLPRGASRVPPPLTIGCVAVLTVVSWWGFNHYSELDVWALYFWGAYGLGVLAAWARASLVARGLLTLLLLMLLVDAAMAFRVRPALAAVTAWALWVVGERDALPAILRATWQALSDASYAIFVVHFAVILGFSAAWSRHASDSTLWAWSFFGLAWLVSVVLGMALHRWVKTPKNWTGIARG